MKKTTKVTVKNLKIIESLNDDVFVDFPFNTENSVENGDTPNVDVFPEKEFLNFVNKETKENYTELYDLQDHPNHNEALDLLSKFANEKNIVFWISYRKLLKKNRKLLKKNI